MVVYITTTMVIPSLTFTYIRNLSIFGVNIVLEQQDYENYKKRFQDWLNNLWENKDRIIEKELV